MMRKEFEMTDEQLDKITKASQPVPYLVMKGKPPRSQQANANDAWKELGEELGFEYMTVKPVAGKDVKFFTADVTQPPPDGDGEEVTG